MLYIYLSSVVNSYIHPTCGCVAQLVVAPTRYLGGTGSSPVELSRGVRQGCPLSPYLLKLGVELLADRIREDCSLGELKCLQKNIRSVNLQITLHPFLTSVQN